MAAFEGVALIAIGGRSNSDYFIAGYALESFASHYLDRPNAQRPRSVEPAEMSGPGNRYLLDVAERMRQKSSLRHSLSPFEEKDAVAGITCVTAPSLSAQCQVDMQAWNDRYPHAVLQFHCSMALTFACGTRNGLRHLYDDKTQVLAGPGLPIIQIAIEPSPHDAALTNVNLFSGASLWLRNGEAAIAGRISPTNADENLALLSRLAGAFVNAAGDRLRSPSLKLDGTTFTREGARLYEAFSEMVPGLPSDITW